MTPPGTVEGDGPIRLFLALELPDDAVVELVRWGKQHLGHGRPVESFHVTLAFLGSQPRAALEPIVAALRRQVLSTEPFELEPVRYRETRSVGMLVLADPSGGATSLAERVQRESRGSRRLRARAASLAAARHGGALSRASSARSSAARDRPIRSIRRRCFAFTSAPDGGAVRGTGIVFAEEVLRGRKG